MALFFIFYFLLFHVKLIPFSLNISSPYIEKMIVLIFDTETTGLLPKNAGEPFPDMIQLAFTLYDTDKGRITSVYNEYVELPPGVVISQKVTELTGITGEMSAEGVPVEEALESFYTAYQDAEMLVAHNIEFDLKIIRTIACSKLRKLSNAFYENPKKMYCTMKEGAAICQIQKTNSYGVYFKSPKLSELYVKLFGGEIPKGLHNAFMDVLCCLRCFVKIRKDEDIPDDVFRRWMLL